MPNSGKKTIVMVQHFPATDNYIVHFQGSETAFFSGEDSINSAAVNNFISECLEEGMYHETTVNMATGKVAGQKTVPLKQTIYCKGFLSEAVRPSKSGKGDINWVMWAPASNELTVNRGILSMSRIMRIASLNDAPEDVTEFMSACTSSSCIALRHNEVTSQRGKGGVSLKTVTEYFFSTGRVIYGFQNADVEDLTEKDASILGLEWYGD